MPLQVMSDYAPPLLLSLLTRYSALSTRNFLLAYLRQPCKITRYSINVMLRGEPTMTRKLTLVSLLLAVLLLTGLPLHAQDTPPATTPINIEIGVYVVGASMFDLETAMYSVD